MAPGFHGFDPSALRAVPGADSVAERLGEVVTSAIDKVVERRWDHARVVAASTSGTTDQRVRQLGARFAREMAAVGAAAGGTAALPAVGTATVVGTSLAELGWFTTRAADLILSVAAVHGHTEATVEQRRGWVLAVLAFGDAASASFTAAAREVGKGLGKKTAVGLQTELLHAVNRAVTRTIVARYGLRRGVVVLGHALPFGIGAVFGGTANWGFARSVAKHADRFFRDLPPELGGPSG